jgi:hypothetical protein
MLTNYIQQVQRLLHDTNAQLYSTSDITIYINEARAHIAADSMSVRAVLSFTTTGGVKSYSLSAITTGMPSGGSYALVVRKAARTISGVSTRIDSRPWDWFFNYCICNPVPASGDPDTWSQLGLGGGGNLYLYPTPSTVETITVDCVIVPEDLIDDTTPEILSYPWTAAVKFYAAYYAYMNSQRNADADRMLQMYNLRMQAASAQSTPDTLPRNLPLSGKVSGVPSATVSPFPGGGNA